MEILKAYEEYGANLIQVDSAICPYCKEPISRVESFCKHVIFQADLIYNGNDLILLPSEKVNDGEFDKYGHFEFEEGWDHKDFLATYSKIHRQRPEACKSWINLKEACEAMPSGVVDALIIVHLDGGPAQSLSQGSIYCIGLRKSAIK